MKVQAFHIVPAILGLAACGEGAHDADQADVYVVQNRRVTVYADTTYEPVKVRVHALGESPDPDVRSCVENLEQCQRNVPYAGYNRLGWLSTKLEHACSAQKVQSLRPYMKERVADLDPQGDSREEAYPVEALLSRTEITQQVPGTLDIVCRYEVHPREGMFSFADIGAHNISDLTRGPYFETHDTIPSEVDLAGSPVGTATVDVRARHKLTVTRPPTVFPKYAELAKGRTFKVLMLSEYTERKRDEEYRYDIMLHDGECRLADGYGRIKGAMLRSGFQIVQEKPNTAVVHTLDGCKASGRGGWVILEKATGDSNIQMLLMGMRGEGSDQKAGEWNRDAQLLITDLRGNLQLPLRSFAQHQWVMAPVYGQPEGDELGKNADFLSNPFANISSRKGVEERIPAALDYLATLSRRNVSWNQAWEENRQINHMARVE